MSNPLARDLDHVLAHTVEVWESLRGQRIFITGGTGFVGAWLVESFVWANERLCLGASAVLISRNPDAFRRKVAAANHSCIEIHKGDIRSFEFAPGDFPFIIHASTSQNAASEKKPGGTFDGEVEATRRVLEFARACGTRRLLLTSSGAVYGKQPSDLANIDEDYAGAPSTVDIDSAYGHAKRASELLCAMHGKQCGFEAVIARLFTFAGPYLPLDINFAVGNFMRDVIAGGPICIAGDGTPLRSYLYAADLTVWLWNLLIRGQHSRPYNVGSPEAVTIADLAKLVAENTIPETEIQIAQTARLGSQMSRYVPSVERIGDELGLAPLIGLDEQIRRMYEWNVYRLASRGSSVEKILDAADTSVRATKGTNTSFP